MYLYRGRTLPSCCIGASLQQFLYPIQRGVAKIEIPTLIFSSLYFFSLKLRNLLRFIPNRQQSVRWYLQQILLQIPRVCDDPVYFYDEVNVSIQAKVKIPGNYIQRRNASHPIYFKTLCCLQNSIWSCPLGLAFTRHCSHSVCVHSGLPYSFSGWSACPPVSVITASG